MFRPTLKILHRNVPNLSLIILEFFLSSALNIAVPDLLHSLFLLASNLPTVTYHGQTLLSLALLEGLGSVPYFYKNSA